MPETLIVSQMAVGLPVTLDALVNFEKRVRIQGVVIYMRLAPLLALLVVMLGGTPIQAAVYKCIDEQRRVTFSHTPCANQQVKTLSAAKTQSQRLQRIDHRRWLGASRANGEDAYWIARYAFEAHGDMSLALGMAALSQHLGHGAASGLLQQISAHSSQQAPAVGELQSQLGVHVAALNQAKSNSDAYARDQQRQQDLDNIALAVARYVAVNGFDALGPSLIQAGGIELSCDVEQRCSKKPVLIGKLHREGFAPNVKLETCAASATLPCLKLEHFMSGTIPADRSGSGKSYGYHVQRVGKDYLWVTSTRAETLDVLSVGIELHGSDPRALAHTL